MRDYIVFDLENPNKRGNSVCSVGLIIVKNNEIKEKIYSLINPEDRFDLLNIQIHQIEPHMVLNSPTLKDFWPSIKDYFINNIIVGHNIRYDLNVLSRALERYDIEVPEFKYCCTLDMSRALLRSKSNKLSVLAEQLGITYNEHNALDDAFACQKLFEYLQKQGDTDNFIRPYSYETILKAKIDEQLISNLNSLHGIIKGISADEKITIEEIDLLNQWIDNNLINRQYQLFSEIIDRLEAILEDNIVTDYELIELKSITQFIGNSRLYSANTLAIQVLNGIIEGIIADKKIEKSELLLLENWMKANSYLKGVFPYDSVFDSIEKVLEDGIVTEEEEKDLLQKFDKIVNPTQSSSEVDLSNCTYCLTGEFKHGSKGQINVLLKQKGAIEKSGVSSKTDYLFVGGIGSDAWAFGNYGGKIAKAMELIEKGSKIQIISEDDLFEKYLI